MVGQCEACRETISVTQKRIKCSICLLNYHSECINYNNESAPRSQWKCPKCVGSLRKGGDNSNTPIRSSKPATRAEDSEPQLSPSISTNLPSAGLPIIGTTASHDCRCTTNDIVAQMDVLLDSKLKKMKADIVQELKTSFTEEIRNEMSTILAGLSQLEESHNNLVKEHESLKKEHEQLQKTVSQSESQISELRGQLGKQQQWARISNLEIVGLPETSNESPTDLTIKIASHAGVELKLQDIEGAYRVQPMQKIEGRPKPIVVKLKNRMLKDQIISGLRKARGVNTGDIGLGGSSKRFFVNEHLTPENKILLKMAKARGLDKSYKFIWVRNCNIFLRRNEESPSISINSEKDLLKIV